MFFDFACLCVVAAGALLSLYRLPRHRRHIALTMARYINAALLFKLSGEVIRLISCRTFEEAGLVACIVAIHGSISFLISWEVRREEKRRDSPDKKKDIGEDIFL
jgi:uncharacterized membrane protein